MMAFVVWVIGWWLIYDVADYFSIKGTEIRGAEHLTTGAREFNALFHLVVWIVVGMKLWAKV